MAERPRNFSINRGHPLARDLVFAGLGNPGGVISKHYQDSSPYCNHGTMIGMNPSTQWVWTPELGRWAVDFGAANDYIISSRLPRVAGDLSACLWQKTLTWPGGTYPGLIGIADTYPTLGFEWFVVGTTGNIDVYQRTALGIELLVFTYVVPTGVWVHLAMTRRSGVWTLYVNGVLSQSVSPADMAALLTTDYIVLGGLRTDYPNSTGCQADHLLYSRAISSSEIACLANPANAMLGGLLMPPKRKVFAGMAIAFPQLVNGGLTNKYGLVTGGLVG